MGTIIKPNRRGFLSVLASLIVAPAIVKVENIMPVVSIIRPDNLVPYKGKILFDAGLFYCPYIPLIMDTAGLHEFKPKIGFNTRYGVVDGR